MNSLPKSLLRAIVFLRQSSTLILYWIQRTLICSRLLGTSNVCLVRGVREGGSSIYRGSEEQRPASSYSRRYPIFSRNFLGQLASLKYDDKLIHNGQHVSAPIIDQKDDTAKVVVTVRVNGGGGGGAAGAVWSTLHAQFLATSITEHYRPPPSNTRSGRKVPAGETTLSRRRRSDCVRYSVP